MLCSLPNAIVSNSVQLDARDRSDAAEVNTHFHEAPSHRSDLLVMRPHAKPLDDPFVVDDLINLNSAVSAPKVRMSPIAARD